MTRYLPLVLLVLVVGCGHSGQDPDAYSLLYLSPGVWYVYHGRVEGYRTYTRGCCRWVEVEVPQGQHPDEAHLRRAALRHIRRHDLWMTCRRTEVIIRHGQAVQYARGRGASHDR